MGNTMYELSESSTVGVEDKDKIVIFIDIIIIIIIIYHPENELF